MTSDNELILRTLMSAMSARNIEAVEACLHEEVVFELPYREANPVLDRVGLLDLLRSVFNTFASVSCEVTHVYDLASPDGLIARYEGDFRTPAGISYANHYIGVFGFTDGWVSSWREYHNPLITQAFVDEAAAG